VRGRIIDELQARLMEILGCFGIGVDCMLKEVANNVEGAWKPNNAQDNEGVVLLHCGYPCLVGLSNLVSLWERSWAL
jgi:hypothetical protein